MLHNTIAVFVAILYLTTASWANDPLIDTPTQRNDSNIPIDLNNLEDAPVAPANQSRHLADELSPGQSSDGRSTLQQTPEPERIVSDQPIEVISPPKPEILLEIYEPAVEQTTNHAEMPTAIRTDNKRKRSKIETRGKPSTHEDGRKDGENPVTDQYRNNLRDIILSPSIGYSYALSHSPSWDSGAFRLGADISYFLTRQFGLIVPYSLQLFDQSHIHRVGAGPIIRPIQNSIVHSTLHAAYGYTRILNRNKQSWSVGTSLSITLSQGHFKPSIGPFVRYQQIILPGKDLTTLDVGLLFNLVGHSEIDW